MSKPSSMLRRSSSPRAVRSAAVGRVGRLGQLEVDARRSSSTTASASPTGSSRTSGAPVSTWLPADTGSSRTIALNGACSTVSIFMLSSTSTGAPASTSAPTATGVATTSAGAAARSTPPSSRLTRCVTPSTSTRCTGPCVAVTSRNRRPATTRRASYSSSRSMLDVQVLRSVADADADAVPAAARSCATVTLYDAPRSFSSIARPTSCCTCGRPPRAVSSSRCRSTRSASSYASIAAATSATPECRLDTSRPSPRTRSIQPVSALPSITSGWSSRSRTKLLLVEPPSITTVVSATARRSRPSASSRVRP